MSILLELAPHPLLDVAAFVTEFPRPLAEMPSSPELLALLDARAAAPFQSDEMTKEAVRAMLRHGGFKPSGRSKPASEYLVRAIAEGLLSSINLAVDACNAASFHSGLPISVVDLDRVALPGRIELAPPGANYVFNVSGQTMDLSGLIVLADAHGPCANAVKDSQRTKTCPETRRTLSVVWSSRRLADRALAVARWYQSLLGAAGARVTDVATSNSVA